MDVQAAIERLYEDESLTSALEDTAAQPLMKWGERQLERLTQAAPDEPHFEQDFAVLRKLIKRIGRYIDRRGEWSEAEQADELDVIKGEAQKISAPLTLTTPADYAKKTAVEVVTAMIGGLTGVIAAAKPDEGATQPTEQQTGDSAITTAKGSESQQVTSVEDVGKTKPLSSKSAAPSAPDAAPEDTETPSQKDSFLGNLIKRIFEE